MERGLLDFLVHGALAVVRAELHQFEAVRLRLLVAGGRVVAPLADGAFQDGLFAGHGC